MPVASPGSHSVSVLGDLKAGAAQVQPMAAPAAAPNRNLPGFVYLSITDIADVYGLMRGWWSGWRVSWL